MHFQYLLGMEPTKFNVLSQHLCDIFQLPATRSFLQQTFPLQSITGFYHVDVDCVIATRVVKKINKILTRSTHHLSTSEVHTILPYAFTKIMFRPIPREFFGFLAASTESRDRYLCDMLYQCNIHTAVTVQFNKVHHIDPVDNVPVYISSHVVIHMARTNEATIPLPWPETVMAMQICTTLAQNIQDDGIQLSSDIYDPITNEKILSYMRGKCVSCGDTGTERKLRICRACKATAYCDKVCQEKDWPTHRHVCAVRCAIAERTSLCI